MPENQSFGSSLGQGMLGSAGSSFASTIGSGLGNAALSAIFGKWQQRQQLSFMKKQLDAQNAAQLNYEKQHAEAFSKSWERRQLEEAGLNPAIMYGGKSGGGASGAAAGAPGSLPSGIGSAAPNITGQALPANYGQIEIATSQADLNRAQAEYWRNKSVSEEKQPNLIQSQTDLNKTIEDFKKTWDPQLAQSKVAYQEVLTTLTQIQESIERLTLKGLEKSYTFSYYSSDGRKKYTQTNKGWELPYLIQGATLVGNIIENTRQSALTPTLIKQTIAQYRQILAQTGILHNTAAMQRLELAFLRSTHNYRVWREYYNTANEQLSAELQQWKNRVAPSQQRYENYIKGASLFMQAFSTGASLYNARSFRDAMMKRPSMQGRTIDTFDADGVLTGTRVDSYHY